MAGIRPGYSILLLGPSGAGKSTTVRGALKAEGSGYALLAPGEDEITSYLPFLDNPAYGVKGFDDPEFLPHAGLKMVKGLRDAMLYANAIRKALEEDVSAGVPIRYKVVAVDKISGIAELAVNVMLKETGLSGAPPAQSPDGATYYVGIANHLFNFMRPLMAARAMGAHLIVTSHITEREVSSTAMAEADRKAEVALIPGKAFREALPGKFDLVFYVDVNDKAKLVNGKNDPENPRHFLQWMPDRLRPTKSRFGALLPEGKKLPNEWEHLKPVLDAARERLENN